MAMSVGDSRLIISQSQAATAQAPTRVFRVSQVRRLRKCQQVAAVCYRIRGSGIEFLLVQTRGGRWTFPKGGVEPGLTHAQAAALEAYEEAGAHGDRKSTRLNSSHSQISYAVFCLKKKNNRERPNWP